MTTVGKRMESFRTSVRLGVLLLCFACIALTALVRGTGSPKLDSPLVRLLAAQCTPALVLDSPELAGETLAPLVEVPTVQSATLANDQGRVLANYKRPGDVIGKLVSSELPILSEGHRLGTLRLQWESPESAGSFWLFLLLGLVVPGGWIVGGQFASLLLASLSELEGELRSSGWSDRVLDSLPREVSELLRTVHSTSQSRQDQDLYTVLTSSLQEIVLEINSDLTVRALNRTGLERLGYAPETVVGFPASRLLENGDTLFSEWIAGEGTELPRDTRLLTSSGEPLLMRVSGTILKGEEGNRLICVARDLSPMVRARQAEERYTQLLDSSHDLIPIMDEEGRVTSSNRAWRTALGYGPNEALEETSIFNLIHPDHRENFRRIFKRLMAGEAVPPFEALVQGRDGKTVTVEGRLDFQTSEGSTPVVRGIFRDISRRRQVEQALEETERRFLESQKMEAVGRLAGGIAHDFNNVLTAISGYAELMLESANEEFLVEGLTEVSRAADRARDLTRQLLTFGRKNVVRPEVLDFSQVLQETDKILRRLMGKDIELVTTVESDLAGINADPGQLEQVLMNLAINARQAMPTGGHFRIQARTVERDSREWVRIEVSDTGCGMTESTRERIFEPFFTTKEEGTGLGLATAYGIVTRFGGELQVESSPGHGTLFIIDFPAVELPRIEEGVRPASSTQPTPRYNETVMVVEDEAIVRRLVEKILKRDGYTVLSASYGDEALRVARQHEGRIDLLITDMVMPKMGGRVLASKFEAERPETPVLYMSGYSEDPFLNSVVAFIPKPFSPTQFLEKVRSVIEVQPVEALAG